MPRFVTNSISFAAAVNLAAYSFRCSSLSVKSHAAARRRKLRIVRGCGKPRRLLTPLLLLSVKSHAAARRHKLRIACGCVPRRLLTPLFLLSVKSHAAIRLFACKRAHNGSFLLPTFYGENALTTAHSCYQLFTGKTRSQRLILATNFLRGKRARNATPCYQLFTVSDGQVFGKKYNTLILPISMFIYNAKGDNL